MTTPNKFACLALTAMTLALPGTVQAAECKVIAAAGNGPTKDIATMMSTHGLSNIIENTGMKGQGAVKTSCAPGTFLTECRSQQKACK